MELLLTDIVKNRTVQQITNYDYLWNDFRIQSVLVKMIGKYRSLEEIKYLTGCSFIEERLTHRDSSRLHNKMKDNSLFDEGKYMIYCNDNLNRAYIVQNHFTWESNLGLGLLESGNGSKLKYFFDNINTNPIIRKYCFPFTKCLAKIRIFFKKQ